MCVALYEIQSPSRVIKQYLKGRIMCNGSATFLVTNRILYSVCEFQVKNIVNLLLLIIFIGQLVEKYNERRKKFNI